MKSFFALLLTALFCHLHAFAQSNFKPGYIITTKGDTVKGLIDYREWNNNPTEVTFKTSAGTPQKFTPADLLSFNIYNIEMYQTYSGPISHDETSENRLVSGRDTSYFTKDVFLKVLNKGKVITLYAYIDAIKPRFLYSEPADNMPKELIYRIYYSNSTTEPARGRTITENAFMQQLSAIALKANVLDDRMQQAMDRVNYNEYDLIRIAAKMNGPAEKLKGQGENYNGGYKGIIDLYAGAGINITTFTPHNAYAQAGGTANTSAQPRVDFGVNFYANPNTRKLVFILELGISQNKYKDLYTNKIYPYVDIAYKFNEFEISLTPQIAYNFYNSENFKLFAGLGYNLSYYSLSNKTYQQQNGQKIATELDPFAISNAGNSLYYKAGVLIKNKFQMYASYISGTGISNDRFFNITQHSVQAGINYFFK